MKTKPQRVKDLTRAGGGRVSVAEAREFVMDNPDIPDDDLVDVFMAQRREVFIRGAAEEQKKRRQAEAERLAPILARLNAEYSAQQKAIEQGLADLDIADEISLRFEVIDEWYQHTYWTCAAYGIADKPVSFKGLEFAIQAVKTLNPDTAEKRLLALVAAAIVEPVQYPPMA